jgi:hypothetical protein
VRKSRREESDGKDADVNPKEMKQRSKDRLEPEDT